MPYLLLVLLVSLTAGSVQAGDYDFEVPEAEKKPYTLGGRLEARYLYHRHDEAALPYRLNEITTGEAAGADTHEGRSLAELAATWRRDPLQVSLRTHHQYAVSQQAEDDWDHRLYEGYLSLTPTPHLTMDGGKKSVLWGKGYAWNPAGFINRPKDPDDPSQSLEGRTQLGIDLIKSFDVNDLSLANLGLTLLLLPVVADWANEDLGETGDLNTALKLYLLWRDTDIDLIYFDGPEQPTSLGMDVARNLAENVEVHAEAAWRRNAPRVVVDAEGGVRRFREDQFSLLLGTRYLNRMETTFIAEYYHNGAGYDADEMAALFDYQEAAIAAWHTVADVGAARRAAALSRPYYRQRNFGRHYAYLKVSQKEPFDILYLTPWMGAIVNLADGSFNLQPGVTWTPVTNLEVNLRAGIPVGPRGTEYGEKADAVRPEVWARCYF